MDYVLQMRAAVNKKPVLWEDLEHVATVSVQRPINVPLSNANFIFLLTFLCRMPWLEKSCKNQPLGVLLYPKIRVATYVCTVLYTLFASIHYLTLYVSTAIIRRLRVSAMKHRSRAQSFFPPPSTRKTASSSHRIRALSGNPGRQHAATTISNLHIQSNGHGTAASCLMR